MCSLCNFLRIVYVPVWHTDDGGSSGQRNTSVGSDTWQNTLGSRFATVSFTTIHFYDPLSSQTEHTPDLWRIAVSTQASFSPLGALVVLFRCGRVSSFSIFSAVLLSWLWFFHSWRPSKRQKRTKNQHSWRYILSWCLLNHGLGLLQQNKEWFDWYIFFQLSVIFHEKDKIRKKIKTFDITFFSTTSWAFFSKIKSDLTDICFQLSVIFHEKDRKEEKNQNIWHHILFNHVLGLLQQKWFGWFFLIICVIFYICNSLN
jgi:hypothetical protein